MARIGFVSYEIHPATKGGCGVLLHHAATVLLERGHEVVFLLDLPRGEFEQFRDHDRLEWPQAAHCRAYHVGDLLAGFPAEWRGLPDSPQLRSLRFAHALRRLLEREPLDYVEFFDYCGVAFYAQSERLYADQPSGPVLGVRLHSTLELLDRHGPSNEIDRQRYGLWGLERGALRYAEAVLTPTQRFYEEYYRSAYVLPQDQVVVSQSPKQPFPRVQRRPAPNGPFRIMFFGRMFHLKGVDEFVHAGVRLLKQRPDLPCTFDLIGYDSQESPFGGSYTAHLKRMIPQALRDRFVFTGHVTHEQVVERLNDTLFAVFPNRLESFCYALHEVYDAGVPVIVNCLPAFNDFFRHKENAFVYNGTVDGLTGAMRALIDDAALRERLCRPYPVAQEPLGTFYDAPQALAPVVTHPEARADELNALLVVQCPTTLDAARPTLDSIQRQTARNFQTVCLVAATDDEEETLWWLGRRWHVRTPAGEPLSAADLVTADALAIFQAGDVLDARWLALCLRALARRPDLAFAGTWARRGSEVVASRLDAVPELYPFEHGATLTRTLVRTSPGRPLIDLFDSNLGALGEIGHLWLSAGLCPGRLFPHALIQLADTPDEPLDLNLLQYLLASQGRIYAGRLALLSGIIRRECGSPREIHGREALRIVIRKVRRRLGL